jgi:Rrf2 family protein
MNSLFKVSAKNHAGMLLMSLLAAEKGRVAKIESLIAEDAYVSLKDVAKEMGLSQKFLEEIAAALKKAKLIEGRKGPGGGYKLARASHEISVYEIVTALEGPITGLNCGSGFCPVSDKCSSKSLWKFLHEDLIKSLKQTNLMQIIEER